MSKTKVGTFFLNTLYEIVIHKPKWIGEYILTLALAQLVLYEFCRIDKVCGKSLGFGSYFLMSIMYKFRQQESWLLINIIALVLTLKSGPLVQVV